MAAAQTDTLLPLAPGIGDAPEVTAFAPGILATRYLLLESVLSFAMYMSEFHRQLDFLGLSQTDF